MKISVIAMLSAVVVVGCGSQSPKRYEMSVDTSAFLPGTFPTSCTPSDTSTTTFKESLTDNRAVFQYEIWTASDGKTAELTTSTGNLTYLIGAASRNVSSSSFAPLQSGVLNGTIESTDGKTFKLGFSATGSDAGASETDAATVTFAFADNSYTKGTISVTASRDCSGGACDPAEKFTCSPASLPFVATQVTGTNVVNY